VHLLKKLTHFPVLEQARGVYAAKPKIGHYFETISTPKQINIVDNFEKTPILLVGELNAIVNIFTAATSSQLVKSPRTDDNKLLQIFFIQLALSLIEIHKITEETCNSTT
jgi:hypothetical protein